MIARLARLTTALQYQVTLGVALLLLPIATLASRIGLHLPVHRVLERSRDAYRNAR